MGEHGGNTEKSGWFPIFFFHGTPLPEMRSWADKAWQRAVDEGSASPVGSNTAHELADHRF